MTDQPDTLAGRHLLVVEDEYLLADDLASKFRAQGASVVGPAANVEDALALLDGSEPVDCAVLDINLQGEKAFPIADLLMERDVPFVFATGYDASAIPERFDGVQRFEKPVEAAGIVRALLG
ncbi:response regulator [Sphingomonas lenta]|uniref:Response regulatory domain-containing protein n=1 Tax=Sphingomonas lenta TaxID=1141887 RepID=A0A2A2SFJ2_9SPHN|nr:response regulator [Sphingomonas lenta]PAX07975.1 hypothetical protein CKY28_10255 [Sphingomonas lenta]